jgi:hypothetical protein
MNTNIKILLGFLVIIVLIYFLSNKRQNPYRNLDNNNLLLEKFTTKTSRGQECIAWENAVQFQEYGKNKTCRNPENDVNGSWCYTDSYGNYGYCDSFEPGCVNMKVLEGCFKPNKNGYQLVIYNSQPFNEPHLDIDMIADSVNQIWVVDKSGRFLRSTKKSKYVNFIWEDMISDSLNNYEPDNSNIYNIAGIGLKRGGFLDTFESVDEKITSMEVSEMCYLFLKNNNSNAENKIMTSFFSKKINIQDDDNSLKYHNLTWDNSNLVNRKYINLGKKMMIDQDKNIFSIHNEKINKGKGMTWGDIVIGRNDGDNDIKFNLIGNTFPKDITATTPKNEIVTDEPATKEFNILSNKKFFSPEMYQFVNKKLYELNEAINKQDSKSLEDILDYLNGRITEGLSTEEKESLKEFKMYLRYRIILNDDFRYKNEEGNLFTYKLIKDDEVNTYFTNDDLYSFMNSIPFMEYRRFIYDKLRNVKKFKRGYNLDNVMKNFRDIDKYQKSIETFKELNTPKNVDGAPNLNYDSNLVCLENIKFTIRSDESFGSDKSLEAVLNEILFKIKDIKLDGSNLKLKNELKEILGKRTDIVKTLKKELDNQETTQKYNKVLDNLIEISKIFDSKKTSKKKKTDYLMDNYGIDLDEKPTEEHFKKMYYYIVEQMMEYYISFTKDIYRRIERGVDKIKNIVNERKDTIYNNLLRGNCYEKEVEDVMKYNMAHGLNSTEIRNIKNNISQYKSHFRIDTILKPQPIDIVIRKSIRGWTFFSWYTRYHYGRIKLTWNTYQNKYIADNPSLKTNIINWVRRGGNFHLYYPGGKVVNISNFSKYKLDYLILKKPRQLQLEFYRRYDSYAALKKLKNEKILRENILININNQILDHKKEYADEFKTYTATLTDLLKSPPDLQGKDFIEGNLYDSLNNLKKINQKDFPVSDTTFKTGNKACVYKKNTSPSGISDEKNCFQDFVNHEMIQLENVEDLLEKITEGAKYYIYKITITPDTNGNFSVSDLSKIKDGSSDKITRNLTNRSDTVLPEIAKFVSEIQLSLSNVRRNETLLRYNTQFFYLLDDLLEEEERLEDEQFNENQKETINKIFNLFFDTYNYNRDTFKSEYNTNGHLNLDIHTLLPDELQDGMYLDDQITKLFPDDYLTIDEEKYPGPADPILSNKNCDSYYENREFLKKLEFKEFILRELKDNYIKNKSNINLKSFNGENVAPPPAPYDIDYEDDDDAAEPTYIDGREPSLDISKGAQELLNSCLAAKKNYQNRFLINNVRDDLMVFEAGEFNPGSMLTNFYEQLENLEADSKLKFDANRINEMMYALYDKNKQYYDLNYDRINNLLKDSDETYKRTIEFLKNKKSEEDNVSNELSRIQIVFEEMHNLLAFSSPAPTESLFDGEHDPPEEFDRVQLKGSFTSIQNYYNEIDTHFEKVKQELDLSFPNPNLLNYLRFLTDFEKSNEVDIIRKIEIAKENIKILGEINNLMLHDELKIGVVDFNLTNDYLYIDYLFPSKSSDGVENEITKYDWNTPITLIKSLNLITVRLKKKYIDYVNQKHRSQIHTLKYLGDIDQNLEPEQLSNKYEGNLILFETDMEGNEEKILRKELNICKKIFKKYNDEHVKYKDLDTTNEQYEKLLQLMLIQEINKEVNKHKFIEQGRVFVKHSTEDNEKNKLHISLKEFDSSISSMEQNKKYNEYVNVNVGVENINTTTKNVRYFHDYSERKDHPNLFDTKTSGSNEDRMIYKIIPGSLYSGTSVYGLMNYNFTNSLYKSESGIRKQLNNVYFKKNVFFQVYAQEINKTDIGPVELINKSELSYTLTPEVKYTHGIKYTPEGKIEISPYYGLLYWFYLQHKDGAFINIDEWLPYYNTLREETLYTIGADSKKMKLNTNFTNQFEEYAKSLSSKKAVGRLSADKIEILKKLKNFKTWDYKKEENMELRYPQINLDRLLSKKYSNQVFIQVNEFDKEIEKKDISILLLVKDTDERMKDPNFRKKYKDHIQDKPSKISFEYEYYKLVKVNKMKTLMNEDFCGSSSKMNKYNSLWRYKVIRSFNEYQILVEGDDVRDEATNRIKGLYDIHDMLKDKDYYDMIEKNYMEIKDLSLKKTFKKILEDKKKNVFRGAGYPFMVVYQVRDYKGYPCLEGSKNSQRIFLTCNLHQKFIHKNMEDTSPELIGLEDGPIISEEFISYTGHGSTIRFSFQKVRGSTPIETKGVCPTADYSALPGYSDDCSGSSGCGDKVLGMTRLDGIPKCELSDSEVKTKPVGSMDVSIPGNVSLDACDIYKIKGNKRIKYKLGKMFGYNSEGKYQLKNQYTLQYGDYFFYFNKTEQIITFKDELDPNPNEIGNFSFNLTYGEDKYGTYILLNPHNGPKGENGKYLTRIINIFDKHFDEWVIELKFDKATGKKDYIRDIIDPNNFVVGKDDNEFYAQKFNLPEDILMKIANEEGIKSDILDKMKGDLEKNNYLFCNLTGPGGNSICNGDFNAKPSMTIDEENEILRQQASQITNLMKRFNNIPKNYFELSPQNDELVNFMKNSLNIIKEAKTFVYKKITDVNWIVKTQMDTNNAANRLKKQQKIFSVPSISGQNQMNIDESNEIDESSIMKDALKDMERLQVESQYQPRQCKSIEGFENISPAPTLSDETNKKYNKHISGKYYNYVQDEIEKKKQDISKLNDNINNLLSQLNKMSDGMDLSGEKKQVLISQMIEDKNNLEKMVFDIKNYEQQDRMNKIQSKLGEIESIRGEIEEDDFMTHKPTDDINNVSVISREDGEFLNMYRINKNNTPDHLLFINGGCLEYDSTKKDLKIGHCQSDVVNQQFNVFRMEDKNDMEEFNLKNIENGIEKPFGMVMTKDKKCLHKENGEVSVRKCNNIKNQYWDYSSITGPCNTDN